MPEISEPEKFLYENFELLFSKEPIPCADDRDFRLENRISVISKDGAEEEYNAKTEQKQYLKKQFDSLRKMIDEMIEAENQLIMTGGSRSSLSDIKQYIIQKIQNIIPRD